MSEAFPGAAAAAATLRRGKARGQDYINVGDGESIGAPEEAVDNAHLSAAGASGRISASTPRAHPRSETRNAAPRANHREHTAGTLQQFKPIRPS